MRSASAMLVSMLVLGAFAQAEERHAYKVIVNPNHPATSVERRFLSDAFLKKATR
ncbi:MAG: hypothetical protein JNG84_07390, partial [Archangium sp.]|nr:hypothetical protein [Archangium sp.]